MSARPRFEEVLDACIDDIAAGRRTVEQCLAAWPQHRDALADVLDAASALHELPKGAERPPDPARRAQFMSQIRTLPQEPLLETVTTERPRRRPGWIGLPASGVGWLFAHGWGAVPTIGRAGAIAMPAAAAAMLAIVLVLGGGSSSAHAATLTVFGGAVERDAGDGWSALGDGAEIDEGDHLRTGADGRALITFADGSTVALDPLTELSVAELSFDGARRITLAQASGRLWHDVAPSPGGDGYTIETPDAIVTAQGTLFETLVRDGQTTVTTEEGSVDVLAGQLRASVRAGETTVAQSHRLLAAVQRRQAHPDTQLQLSVDAPFTASFIDEHERAVGALPNGLVYRQVPDATTTNPGQGAQQIAVNHAQDGTYELVLRRFGDGAGVIVVRIGDQVHRIPVDAVQNAIRIRLRIVSRDGRREITSEVIEQVARNTLEDVIEHLVVTDRARENAKPVAEQRALLAERPPSQPTRPAATATRTASPSDVATATAEGGDATPVAVSTAEPDATPSTSGGELTIEEAAERCANGIRFGSASIEECQARWPQFGERLVELVRLRLQELQRIDISLDEAFRICLFELASGDHTPQDCYDRWPHYAEQLAELLRIAIGADAVPRPTGSPLEPTTTDDRDAPGSTLDSASGSLTPIESR